MDERPSRRDILLIGGSSIVTAGCQRSARDATPHSQLQLSAETYQQSESWYAEVSIVHTHSGRAELHDVTIIGYSQQGEPVFRRNVGNSTGPPSAALDTVVSVQPARFPYVIAAKAEESPCDSGFTFEMIRWNGTDQEKRSTVPSSDPHPWETFERRCEEELPPERLLPGDTRSPGTTVG